MNESAYELIRTIAWTVLALAAIQGATTYAIVRLLVTGRAVFERRDQGGKVFGIDR